MDVRILSEGDLDVLDSVADGVFDDAVEPRHAAEFLGDPRHHICVAVEGGVVVGFASAVHYLHPDKPTELWINEVGVASSFQRRGAAKAIIAELLRHARSIGCREAWVLTDDDNAPARALYATAGGEESHGVVMVTFKLA